MGYSGDPSANTVDEIRFRIGDTDSSEELLTDSEIEYAISKHESIWGACAECAEAIASQFAKRTDVDTFGINVDLSEKQEHFEKLAKKFRAKQNAGHKPIVGGISSNAKEDQQDRSDRVDPRFSRGMHDNSSS